LTIKNKITKGVCVVVEGSDGAGKTTLVSRLLLKLDEDGYDVCDFREPGGTPYAEHLRELLRALAEDKGVSKEATATTFVASRLDLLIKQVVPAMNANRLVLLDRYTPSTIAYQKYLAGVDSDLVDKLVSLTSDLLEPALVLYLRTDPERCQERIKARDEDREVPNLYALRQLERGYDAQLEHAHHHPHERPYWFALDGNREADDLVMQAYAHVVREVRNWRA